MSELPLDTIRDTDSAIREIPSKASRANGYLFCIFTQRLYVFMMASSYVRSDCRTFSDSDGSQLAAM